MPFVEIGSKPLDIKKELGKPYTGQYKGKKERVSNFDPTKKAFTYSFVSPEGQPFEIYGFSDLDRKMEPVPAGAVCRITYIGKEKRKYKVGGEKDTNIARLEIEIESGDLPEFPPADAA